MATKNEKIYFWVLLSAGITVLASGLFSYFYYFNTAHYKESVFAKQIKHEEYQFYIQDKIASFIEHYVIANNRSNSIYLAKQNKRYFKQNQIESADLFSDNNSITSQPHSFKINTEMDENIKTDKKLNKRLFRGQFTQIDGLKLPTGRSSLFDSALRNENTYPDPVGKKIKYFAGLQAGLDVYTSPPNVSSTLLLQNTALSSTYKKGKLETYTAQISQSYTIGLIAGVVHKEFIELQIGINYHKLKGSALAYSNNSYEEKYSVIEGIIVDGDVETEQTIDKIKTIAKTDTLNSIYSSESFSIPINIRIKKNLGEVTAFVSAGVSLAVFEKSKLETQSRLFNTENNILSFMDKTRESYHLGLGLDYDVLPHFTLRLEPSMRYTPANYNSLDENKSSSSFGINAGFYYRF